MDIPQRGPAQSDGGGNVQKPALHQNHVGSVDGYVRPRSDGDSNVRSGQGRRVVDAVTDHCHLPLLLQTPYHALLAVRKHSRDYLVNSRLRADGLGSAFVVAGEHHDPNAHTLQFLYRLWTVFLDYICYCQQSQELFMRFVRKEHRRFSLCRQRRSLLHQGAWVDARFLQHGRVASNAHRVPDGPPDALSMDRRKVRRWYRSLATFLARLHNRLGQGML